ncbi:hypothetical protein LPU83_pLPU83c_0122 (plasmid) [Rhizobium favelukesii]|uniref:Uncharacterized protein n=1 Tax=Rhizobium favelukesii TaxID=348824 RepID=W6RIJ3_9HYPH|nr:hypothetical protein LPU83_pLPU83c_0122 [Rhizobium favelukesii]
MAGRLGGLQRHGRAGKTYPAIRPLSNPDFKMASKRALPASRV